MDAHPLLPPYIGPFHNCADYASSCLRSAGIPYASAIPLISLPNFDFWIMSMLDADSVSTGGDRKKERKKKEHVESVFKPDGEQP